MRYRRSDVVARAIEVLDDFGLADLSMRRLGTELGVQPSALYHHFANKQSLLAAVADEMLARAAWPTEGQWVDVVSGICVTLRDTLLTWRDGAELVATVWAFGLGAAEPYDRLVAALTAGGLEPLAPVAARTLLHYVYGHAVDEQTHLQAASAGAIEGESRDGLLHDTDFGDGLRMIITGIQVVQAAR